MAQHVEYWNAEELEMSTSREEYTELRQAVEYDETVGDYYRVRETRSVPGYIHDRTGLMLTDIAKFETWLSKIEGR